MAAGKSLGPGAWRPRWWGVKSRFVLVGCVNTAFGLSVFPALIWIFGPLHIPYLAALVVGHPLAIGFSFVTNKFFTFQTRSNYLAELSKFGSFYILVFLANLALLPACVEWFHLPLIPSQFVIALTGVALSYFWHSRITFKQSVVRIAEP
jgi:putative flippase GtrA